MLNFHRNRGTEQEPQPADRTGDGLAELLEALYAVPAPNIAFDFQRARATSRVNAKPAGWMRHWKPVAGLAAGLAVAAAAAIIAVTAIPSGGVATVNAQQIFSRAQAIANVDSGLAGTPYHTVATFETTGKYATTTETWRQDATHYRTTTTVGSSSFTMVADDSDLWLVQADGTRTVAVRATGQAAGDVSAAEAAQPTSLVQALAQYSQGECQTVSQEGAQAVAGRQAYVIVVTPDASGCADPNVHKKLSLSQPGTMTAWVDEQTFLPLKTEQRDASGTVQATYTVTQIEVGGPIAPSLFAYQPPPGVTPITVTTTEAAKQALAQAGGRPTSGTK